MGNSAKLKTKGRNFPLPEDLVLSSNPAEVATSLVLPGAFSLLVIAIPKPPRSCLTGLVFGSRVYFASDVMGFFVAHWYALCMGNSAKLKTKGRNFPLPEDLVLSSNPAKVATSLVFRGRFLFSLLRSRSLPGVA
jgi:hypothetical protein